MCDFRALVIMIDGSEMHQENRLELLQSEDAQLIKSQSKSPCGQVKSKEAARSTVVQQG